jgi:hypothetical protein
MIGFTDVCMNKTPCCYPYESTSLKPVLGIPAGTLVFSLAMVVKRQVIWDPIDNGVRDDE